MKAHFHSCIRTLLDLALPRFCFFFFFTLHLSSPSHRFHQNNEEQAAVNVAISNEEVTQVLRFLLRSWLALSPFHIYFLFFSFFLPFSFFNAKFGLSFCLTPDTLADGRT